METLISPTGAPGPRIDVLMRGWERMLEFEEEVRTGKRVIAEPIKTEGKKHETKNTTPRRKRIRPQAQS